VITW